LGILNGLCGKDSVGFGWIGASFDDNNTLTKFFVREDGVK
jgi:hypothetical protein